jgi:hypothetical protein
VCVYLRMSDEMWLSARMVQGDRWQIVISLAELRRTVVTDAPQEGTRSVGSEVGSFAMELQGDPDGIQALKSLHAGNKDFLKFLIQEAKSNVDHTAPFSSPDGKKWLLKFDARTGNLEVAGVA